MTGFPKFAIGAAALSLAGACAAQAATADLHTMLVNLPDGSVAQVQYHGKVAPRIAIQPVDAAATDAMAVPDVFDHLALVSAMMDRQADAMMQQAAMLQQAALAQAQAGSNAPGMTVASMGTLPQGVHMTYVSSTTDASGCTRTVSYSSDGSAAAQPRVTQASTGTCDTGQAAAPTAIPASATAPAAKAPAPGQKV